MASMDKAREGWSGPRFWLERRQWLRIGAMGVCGALFPRWSGRADEPSGDVGARDLATAMPIGAPRARSVLVVHLSGGLSQLDTLDPKPLAPVEVRGPFGVIGTAISGEPICEHLPKLAERLRYWSVVRTLAHREHNHLLATHVALTGRDTPIPRGDNDIDRVESRNDFPNFASALDYLYPRADGIPTGVSLPKRLIEGPLTWPGQHAGFLGSKHDPWQVTGDPNDPSFRIDSLHGQPGIDANRLATRRQLLERLNQDTAWQGRAMQDLVDQQGIAFNLLTSARVASAFRIELEGDSVRDRYGRHTMGQSLLLARRLVEAGVPVVQATMGQVQTWDTHVDNWGRLTTLLGQLDQGLAALIDDLATMGLLDSTLVMVSSEFGRTPKISTLPGQSLPGRDHWAHAYSALFAGAGIRGGQILGATDAQAGHPVTQAWTPADVCTTLLTALGVAPDAVLYDPLGRPNHLLNGSVIEPLYSGRSMS